MDYKPVADDDMASSAAAAAAAIAVTEQEYDAVDPVINAANQYSEMFPTLPTPAAPRGKLTGGVWDKLPAVPVARTAAPPAFADKKKVTERATLPSERQHRDKRLAETIRRVATDHGVTIDASAPSATDTVTITFNGTPSQVASARRALFQRAGRAGRLNIPREFHKTLIGAKGKNLHAIQNNTGTILRFPDSESESDEVLVLGEPSAIQAAIRELNAAYDNLTRNVTKSITIERGFRSFVFGPSDETLKALAKNTSTTIVPEKDGDEVKVSGDRDDVARALAELQSILSEKRRTVKVVMYPMPKKQHALLIGPKGAHLNEIQRTTGCLVEVPAEGDQITLRGPDASLMAAMNLIMEKVNATAVEEIPLAPPAAVIFLQKTGGDKLRALEADNVSISVSRATIDIMGLRDNVAAVRPRVVELATFYRSLAYADFSVPRDIAEVVIGKGRKNAAAVKKDHDIDVVVADEGDSQKIVLAGSKDKMRNAFVFFQTLIKEVSEQPTVEVAVDAVYVPAVSAAIKDIAAKHERAILKIANGVVTVRAPKGEINAITQAINAAIDAQRRHIEAHSHTAEVKVEARLVKFIIGKNENAINRVREQTDTKIELLKGEQKAEKVAASKGKAAPAAAAPAAEAKGKGKKGAAAAAPAAAASSDDKEVEYEWFHIQGTKEGVAAAAKQIKERAREISEGGGMVTEELKVERSFHGTLIGPKGANLTSLTNRHGVNIKFPGAESESDVITISGIKASVTKARDELVELLEFEKAQRYRETLNFDAGFVKSSLREGNGRSYALVQIAKENNVRVDFTESGEGVTVQGEKANVAKAVKAIKELHHIKSNSVTVEVTIPRKVYPALIGPKGSRIQEFMAAHGGVQVKFPESTESEVVKISGLTAAVKTAEAALRKAADELDEEKIEVPLTEDARNVRPAVRAIADKHNVRILFPKPDDAKQTMLILGKATAARAAQAEVSALKFVTETFELPVSARGSVIANGALRDQCNTLKVRLACPAQDDLSETYTISGIESDVAAAKEPIAEAVKAIVAAQAASSAARAANTAAKAALKVSQTITVPASKQGAVIGKGGETIRKIQAAHNVRIDIKRESDAVQVRGETDADVAAAIAAIQALSLEASVRIDPAHYAYIIGPKGERLRKLQDDLQVRVVLPRDRRNASDLVVIQPRGDNKDLEAAKTALLALVQEHIDSRNNGDDEDESAEAPAAEAYGADEDLEEGEIAAVPTDKKVVFFASTGNAAARPATGAWANSPSFSK